MFAYFFLLFYLFIWHYYQFCFNVFAQHFPSWFSAVFSKQYMIHWLYPNITPLSDQIWSNQFNFILKCLLNTYVFWHVYSSTLYIVLVCICVHLAYSWHAGTKGHIVGSPDSSSSLARQQKHPSCCLVSFAVTPTSTAPSHSTKTQMNKHCHPQAVAKQPR